MRVFEESILAAGSRILGMFMLNAMEIFISQLILTSRLNG